MPLKQNKYYIDPEELRIPKQHDFGKMLSESTLDPRNPPKSPPIAISIGSHVFKDNIYPTVFGTYGNFSCIVGASKSKKTFLKSALVAGYIGGQAQNYFPDFLGHNTTGKYVIDMDTEQGSYHAHIVYQRTEDMVGTISPNYNFIETRQYTSAQRFELLEWICMDSPYKDNLGLVIVDGIADLLDSPNDQETSNKIVQAIMSWTKIKHFHLLTVIHKNHGSDKPTGHLGSTIMKKAETVAFVENHGDMVEVTPDYTRNYGFAKFSFFVDKNGFPREKEGQRAPFK